MAKTYGGRESLPVRGKWPARCDICGVVWRAMDIRRRPDGVFVCPDDIDERGGQAIDLEISRAHPRGVVDTRGPNDPPLWVTDDIDSGSVLFAVTVDGANVTVDGTVVTVTP